MVTPLFSVVIPTRSRPQPLAEALESVLVQTVTDFEVVVVDDASPIPVEAAGDPRVRVVRRETNGGPPAARNTGIDAARGRLVCFLDDDDLYTPDRLEMAAATPFSVCSVRRGIEGRQITPPDSIHRFLEEMVPVMGQVTVRRDVCPRFDERLRSGDEDSEWWIRATYSLGEPAILREAGYISRSGKSGWRSSSDAITARLLVLRKHPEYFREHPWAAARYWQLIGIEALRDGRPLLGVTSVARSLAIRPYPKNVADLFALVSRSGRLTEAKMRLQPWKATGRPRVSPRPGRPPQP
ncbi:MAG TPA: glycosyltransferase family 2 protein [Actinomycetota bacterium]|nr:glycosyltransferase family 2 protein [Actinomycetota bacterium]